MNGFEFGLGLGLYLFIYREGCFVGFVNGRGLGLLLDGWFAFIRGLKLESAASGRDLVGFGLRAIVPVNVHGAGAQQLKRVVEILVAGLRLADPVIGLAILEQDFGLGDERINWI